MGTINYTTSEYITIGYNCNNIDYNDEECAFYIQDDFDRIKDRLNHESFYFFHVTIEPGYYEGFSINIEFNYPLFFDDFSEKREAQKEVTRIKDFLKWCIDENGCCAVFPGWCTSYLNYKESLVLLSDAVREMRKTVKDTPSHQRYRRGEGIHCF